MVWPVATRRGAASLVPSTHVPPMLPRSLNQYAPWRYVIRACLRDTERSASWIVLSGPRPMVAPDFVTWNIDRDPRSVSKRSVTPPVLAPSTSVGTSSIGAGVSTAMARGSWVVAGDSAAHRRSAGTATAPGSRARSSASAFRWRKRFMLARRVRWPVIAAAIAGLLLGACAPTTSTGSSASPGASPASKVLRMARQAEPFSPFVPWQIDDNPALFISVQVYDTLLRTTKDGTNVEAGLATKWTPSADGLTWTFTLRDGLKFSDGSAMTSSDVKASLDMARGGDKSVWKDSYVAIKDVTATDPKTVTITLKQPYAPLLSVLAMFSGGILPADMAKATDTKDYDNSLAWKTKGTGAYYSEGRKKGDPIILKRNANYWKGTPALRSEERRVGKEC